MHSTRTLRRYLWTITAIYWCVMFILTHVPGEHLPDVRINDKIEHLLAYGGLGGILFLSIWASRPQWQQIGALVLAIGMAYGAIDEWLQAIPFIHRDCSLLDWFADTTGLAVAVIFLTYFRLRVSTPAANIDARQTSDGSGIARVSADQVSGPPDAGAVAPSDE